MTKKTKSKRGPGSRHVGVAELNLISQAFRGVIETKKEFSPDLVRAEALKLGVPYDSISKALPYLFKTFLAERVIQETGKYSRSQKDSQILIHYKSTGRKA